MRGSLGRSRPAIERRAAYGEAADRSLPEHTAESRLLLRSNEEQPPDSESAASQQTDKKKPIGQQDTGSVRASSRHTAAYLLILICIQGDTPNPVEAGQGGDSRWIILQNC